MTESRWARASRADLEALAEACDRANPDAISIGTSDVLARLRASCPPLRTEAEVAAEALAILRESAGECLASGYRASAADRLRALAKEPTR